MANQNKALQRAFFKLQEKHLDLIETTKIDVTVNDKTESELLYFSVEYGVSVDVIVNGMLNLYIAEMGLYKK